MDRIYVGIDWADEHHDIYVTNDSAANLGQFSIDHSHCGLEELKDRLRGLCGSPGSILVAVELHRGALVFNLLEAGYQVYPINPKAVDRYRDRYRMSSSKSDQMDAMVLANILRTDLHLYKPLPAEAIADAHLKQLTRAHKSLVKHKVKVVNQLTSELKIYYPVVLRTFSHIDQEITLAFLERYPSPEEAARASLEELEDFFRGRHYTCPRKVPSIHKSLQEPALRACPELSGAHQIVVRSLVPVLRAMLTQIAVLEKEINRAFRNSVAAYIFSSLPAGQMTAARLNAEIGSDASRFAIAKELQTNAGTAPVTKRSGKSAVVYFRWQCNRHLRDAFQNLARESVKRCAWAREYFRSQLNRGHKPSRAYRALANRWAAIVWKMLQEGECFSEARLKPRPMTAQKVS
jgi:transposase